MTRRKPAVSWAAPCCTAPSSGVAAGEWEQLVDLPFVEFVPPGEQTLGQRPGVDEPGRPAIVTCPTGCSLRVILPGDTPGLEIGSLSRVRADRPNKGCWSI